MLLVGNGRLITRDEAFPYAEDGAVALDGEVIKEVGALSELRAKYPKPSLWTPGGVSSCPASSTSTPTSTRAWPGAGHRRVQPHQLSGGAGRPMVVHRPASDPGRHPGLRLRHGAGLLRDGVTTIFDHHASFCEIPGSLFAIKDVCQELGIRANLCYEVSERDGAEKCGQAIRRTPTSPGPARRRASPSSAPPPQFWPRWATS